MVMKQVEQERGEGGGGGTSYLVPALVVRFLILGVPVAGLCAVSGLRILLISTDHTYVGSE